MSTSVFSNIQNVDERSISFTLSPTKYQYANTFRRAIQSMVPCLGFRADMKEDGSTSDVKVIKNSTPMSNEMLADRVGLLPIAMPKGVVSEWNKNSVLFRLKVKNDTDDFRYVKAEDFECLELREGAEERVHVANTDFFHPFKGETCLLAVLKPKVEGQPAEEIEIEAYASIGIGREHARFNPTSQCSYGNTLDKDTKRINALWLEWLREHKKVDPKDLEQDDARKKRLETEFKSLEIHRCFLVDEEGEPNSFDFTVESIGTMNEHIIVIRALQSLIALCEKYQSIDQGNLPENVYINPTDKNMIGYDIYFQNEDHTLGNLFQTWIVYNRVGLDGINSAGYCVPHPLRDEMKMSIGVEDGNINTVRSVLADAAEGCSQMFATWLTEYMTKTASQTEVLNTKGDQRTVWEAHADIQMRQIAQAQLAKQGVTVVKKKDQPK